MKIVYYFLPFLWVFHTNALFMPHITPNKNSNRHMGIYMSSNDKTLSVKSNKYLQIIRYKSILPTFLLSFSGGWIMEPSLYHLIRSREFIVGTINTLCIMSSSMIINDLFDIEIDRVNNPTRPLVTGVMTKKEAVIFAGGLLGIAELLNFLFLPVRLQIIIHLSILNIVIYTPILKKIFLLKNLSCAFLVSFASYFTGLAMSNKSVIRNYSKQNNIDLLYILSRIIFFGSLHNELLLDMHDIDGDRQNHIDTIPVRFGNQFTWKVVMFITKLNILWNSMHITLLYNYNIGMLLLLTCSPLLYNLKSVQYHHFSKKYIKSAVNGSNNALFMSLLYLCTIATIR